MPRGLLTLGKQSRFCSQVFTSFVAQAPACLLVTRCVCDRFPAHCSSVLKEETHSTKRTKLCIYHCCCCVASACLAEQARSPLRAINCLVPWGTEAIPWVRCSGRMAQSRRRGGGDLARLRLESGYIHHGEAPPIDVVVFCGAGPRIVSWILL